jgi:low temperature requirement protein LtrA
MANLQESSGIGFCIARGSAIAMVDRQVEREQRVTPLELFFDLVVVFAMTQVTQLISAELSWRGAGRGILVLAALWWAWTGYAWLTNSLEPEEGRVRAGVVAAMAAMFLVALAVPRAFGTEAMLFGVAYLLVRLINLLLLADLTASLRGALRLDRDHRSASPSSRSASEPRITRSTPESPWRRSSASS